MASGPDQNYFAVLGGIKQTDRRAPKKRRGISTSPNEEFPVLVEKTANPADEAKFIILQASNKDKTLKEYNPFLLRKCVDAISTQYSSSSFLRDGSLLLLCKNRSIADKFIRTEKLGGDIPVKCSFHASLNKTKGIIYCTSLISLKEEDIINGLSSYGVAEAVHIKRREGTMERNTGLVILSFDRFALPKELAIGFELVQVREYFPNPMRCRKCQRLGHTTKWCTAECETCPICANALPHDTPDAIEKHKTPACVNCKVLGHSASDKSCPSYLQEKEVLKIKTQRKCTKYEAKKIYFANRPVTSVRTAELSFAAAIQTQTPTLTTTVNQTPPVVEKQTTNTTPIPTASSSKPNNKITKKTDEATHPSPTLTTNQTNTNIQTPPNPTTPQNSPRTITIPLTTNEAREKEKSPVPSRSNPTTNTPNSNTTLPQQPLIAPPILNTQTTPRQGKLTSDKNPLKFTPKSEAYIQEVFQKHVLEHIDHQSTITTQPKEVLSVDMGGTETAARPLNLVSDSSESEDRGMETE